MKIKNMWKSIRVFIEYNLYLYTNYFDFPSKFLVRYYFEKDKRWTIEGKCMGIAHMYAYDSTVTIDKLELIHSVYGTCTRERVRQILWKYIRSVRAKLRNK